MGRQWTVAFLCFSMHILPVCPCADSMTSDIEDYIVDQCVDRLLSMYQCTSIVSVVVETIISKRLRTRQDKQLFKFKDGALIPTLYHEL